MSDVNEALQRLVRDIDPRHQPDINLAVDMGKKGMQDALEAIKRNAALCPTAVEASIATVVAGAALAAVLRQSVEKVGLEQVWDGTFTLFSTPDDKVREVGRRLVEEAKRG
jgi:hypothetical protein